MIKLRQQDTRHDTVARQHKYAIHADFLHFPTINLSYRPLVVALLNMLLRIERRLRRFNLLRRARTHRVATPDGHNLKLLQFTPVAAPGGPLPAVIYLHGGAYVLTYASTHVYAVDHYANEVGCAVFLVDYRLAHRHPFPVGFDDCHTALSWVLDHAAELGVDPTRVAVMGDSAGGGLAAAMAQRASDDQGPALRGQVLIYPTLDHRCQTPSATLFTDTPLWNGVSNRGMWECYLRAHQDASLPPYASPGNRENLANLPPAYVETAEFDPLRDEAIQYAQRLQAASVPVELVQTQATVHGFDSVFSSEITRGAMRQRCDFLRTVLSAESAN